MTSEDASTDSLPNLPGGNQKDRVSAINKWVSDLKRTPHIVAPILLIALLSLNVLWLLLTWNLDGLAAFFSIRIPQMVLAAGPLALLAIGGGLVIATAQIDLSATAIAAFSGVVYASMLRHAPDSTLYLIMFVVLLGSACGWLNGLLVSKLGAPSLIVTWAMGILLTVGAILLAKGIFGIGAATSAPMPTSVTKEPGQFGLGGIGFYYFLGIVSLVVMVLSRMSLPREAMAVGADSKAASYIGIRPRQLRSLVFVWSGLLASIAGMMYAHSLGSAPTVDLQQISLDVIAICVLGGALLSGGYFSAISIVAATLFWAFVQLKVPSWGLVGLEGSPAEAEAARVYFSLGVLAAVLIFARQISGNLRPVLTRDEDEI